MPDYFQYPPMEAAKEKQKLSQKPIKKEAM
jgi:hypothetical protein